MALRDPIKERQDAEEAQRLARDLEKARMAELAAKVLKSEDGAALFGYLCRKYHLHGRSFLSADARSACCPFAAATRDGEKEPLRHLIQLARVADPQFFIP